MTFGRQRETQSLQRGYNAIQVHFYGTKRYPCALEKNYQQNKSQILKVLCSCPYTHIRIINLILYNQYSYYLILM